MKKLLVVFLFLLFVLPTPVLAKHKGKTGPGLSASLAKNKLSVTATFVNLSKVKSVNYQLTYDSAKGPQGAGGTVKVGPKNKKISRKLLLGTCSGKVCTWHKGVKNIKLIADFKLKSGGVISYEKRIK